MYDYGIGIIVVLTMILSVWMLKPPKWLCIQYPNNLGLALTSISIDAKDFVSTSVNRLGIAADNGIVLKR